MTAIMTGLIKTFMLSIFCLGLLIYALYHITDYYLIRREQ